jgi:transcriptional regulator GlxA family with amidase domain
MKAGIPSHTPMYIAFVIFNGMTALDFIGVYDPVTRLKTMGFLPDVQWDICAYTSEVQDTTGLRFTPTKVNISLQSYDMVIIPGGFGTNELIDDINFIAWLETAANCKYKVSVCTGSLLLAATGFLKGKKATSHPTAFEKLRNYGVEVVDQRVVDEGDILTARGVTSSIDLGLYLCEKFAGNEVMERIRRQMDYQE